MYLELEKIYLHKKTKKINKKPLPSRSQGVLKNSSSGKLGNIQVKIREGVYLYKICRRKYY